MDRAVHFYTQILGLPLALDAKTFNHVEVGPGEPLVKIGIQVTSQRARRKRRIGIVLMHTYKMET